MGIQLLLNLAGSAVYATKGMHPSLQADYPALVTRLRDMFANKSSAAVSKSLLTARMQKEGESVDNFAEGIHTLAVEAYPDMPPAARDEIMAAQFQRGLRDPEVKKHVILKEATSFGDAVKHAVTYGVMKSIVGIDRDSAVTRSQALVNVVNTSNPPGQKRTKEGGRYKNQNDYNRKSGGKVSSSSSSSEEDEKACWKCGNVGHFSGQCKLDKHLRRKAKREKRRQEKKNDVEYKRNLKDTRSGRKNSPGGWKSNKKKLFKGRQQRRDVTNAFLAFMSDHRSDASDSSDDDEAEMEDPQHLTSTSAVVTYPDQIKIQVVKAS